MADDAIDTDLLEQIRKYEKIGLNTAINMGQNIDELQEAQDKELMYKAQGMATQQAINIGMSLPTSSQKEPAFRPSLKAGYLSGGTMDDIIPDPLKSSTRQFPATFDYKTYVDSSTPGFKRLDVSNEIRQQMIDTQKLVNASPYEAPLDNTSAVGIDWPLEARRGFQKVFGAEEGNKLFDMLPSIGRGSNADVLFNRLFNRAEAVPEGTQQYEAPFTMENSTEGIFRSNLERKVAEIMRPIAGGLHGLAAEISQNPTMVPEILGGGLADSLAGVSSFISNYTPSLLAYANPANLGTSTSTDTMKYMLDKNLGKTLKEADSVIQSLNNEIQSGVYQPTTPYTQYFKDAYYSLAGNLIGLGIGAATGGGAIPGLALMAVSTAGKESQRLQDKGFSETASLWAGAFKGTMEWITELLPMSAASQAIAGKKFSKMMVAEIMSDIPGEELNTFHNELQDAMMEGVTDDTGNWKAYVDTAVVSMLAGGGLMGAAVGMRKGQMYTPVAKAAVKDLYNGLNENLKSGITSEGFSQRVTSSVKDSWNFFKKGVNIVNTFNDIIGNRGSMSFKKKEDYNISMVPRAVEDYIKAKIKDSYDIDLPLHSPIETYYEKLFGQKTTPEDAWKHFLGEDYAETGGVGKEKFDRYAFQHNMGVEAHLDKTNLEHYFYEDTSHNTTGPNGEIFSNMKAPISGNFMVKFQINDREWSRQKEVEVIQRIGNQAIISLNNHIQVVPADKLSIVRPSKGGTIFMGKSEQLIDMDKLTPSRIQNNPSEIFVLANEKEAQKYPNAVSFKTNMSDENYRDNTIHIADVLNRVQRSIVKQTIVPTKTTNRSSNSILTRLRKGETSYLNDTGLELGDIVEINPPDGEVIFARVIKEDPGKWVWSGGGYKPTTSEAGLTRYTVEPVIGVATSGYNNIIIPQNIGQNIRESAPRTYAHLIRKLAEFKQYMNKRRKDAENQSTVIYKNVPESQKKNYTTVYGSLGGQTGYTFTSEKPNEPANIIREAAVLKDGTTVYLTDLGFLDRAGNEYVFDTKEISNYAMDFVAIDQTETQLLATGNTYEEVEEKTYGKKVKILSFAEYLNELKKGFFEDHPIKNIAPFTNTKVMAEAKELYPDVWNMLSNEDVLRTMRIFGYQGFRRPGEKGFSKTVFGAVFLNMASKNLPETLTHEAIHTFVDAAILKDPNLQAELVDLKMRFMDSEVYEELKAGAKLLGEEEQHEKFFKTVLAKEEFLSYFLTLSHLVNTAKTISIGDMTLYEKALELLEKAVNINTKIRDDAARAYQYEYRQKMHEPLWAVHKPAPWEDTVYKFGVSFYKAIKSGDKTSMIVASDKVKDLKVGDKIDILGGGAEGGVTVKVTRIDRGLVSLLGIHKEVNERTGSEYWTSDNKELLYSISATEGLTDFIKSTKGKETPYGKGFVIQGSGTANMFSPDNPNSFWKNKQATRIVFEPASEKKTVKTHPKTFGTIEIVKADQNADIIGMRHDGKHLLNTTKEDYGQKYSGWLGNPFVANDAGGTLTRAQAVEEFRKAFYDKIEKDADFRQAILELRGKKIGYYKPLEKDIHLNIIKEYLDSLSQKKEDTRKPEEFKIKFEETEEDKKVNFVYTKLNDALAADDIKKARDIALWATQMKIVTEEELEKIIIRWQSDRQQPAFSTLFDYATDLGMWIAFAKESYQGKAPMDTQTATGMGVEGGGYQKGRKAAPIKKFDNTKFLGDSFTDSIPTNSGYFEATITGTGFNSIAMAHLNSIIEQVNLWIDLRGLRGLDPTSAIMQSHFSVYPELREMFPEYYKQGEELKSINERIVKQTFNKMNADTEFAVEKYAQSEDIDTGEGYTQRTGAIGREVLSRSLRENVVGETDESTHDVELVKSLTEIKSVMDTSGLNLDDVKKFMNLIKRQVSKIPVAREFIDFMSNEGGFIEVPYTIPSVVKKYIETNTVPRDDRGFIYKWFYHSIAKALQTDQIKMNHPVVEQVIQDIPRAEAAKIVFDYFGYPKNNTFENELKSANKKTIRKKEEEAFKIRLETAGDKITVSVRDNHISLEIIDADIQNDLDSVRSFLEEQLGAYTEGLLNKKIDLSNLELRYNSVASSPHGRVDFDIGIEYDEQAWNDRVVTPTTVKNWKKKNGIHYNPMDIKKAGYRLVHQIGKYAHVDIGRMIDSMISGEMFISETGDAIPVQISALTTKTLRGSDRYIEFIPENMTPEDIIIVGEHDLYTNFPTERSERYRLPRADKATYVKRSFQYLKKNVRDTWGHDEIVVNLRPGNFRLVGDFGKDSGELKFRGKPKEMEDLMMVATDIHSLSVDETPVPFVPVTVDTHILKTVEAEDPVGKYTFNILHFPLTIDGVQYMAEEYPNTSEDADLDVTTWEFDIRNLETGNIEERIGMIEYELEYEGTNDDGTPYQILTEEAIRRNLEWKLQEKYNTKKRAGKVRLSVFNIDFEYDISSRYGAFYVGDSVGVRREKLFDMIHRHALDEFKHGVYKGHNYMWINVDRTIRYVYEFKDNEIRKVGNSLLSETANEAVARIHQELYPKENTKTVEIINSWANKVVSPFHKQQMDKKGFKLDLGRVLDNERGSSQLLSIIPRMIAKLIKRLSTRTKASPDVVSDQLKKLMNLTQKIKMDIPKLLKDAEFFNQSPEDYITGMLVNNGLPETTTDGSMSARGMAKMIVKDIMDEDVTKLIQKDVEDFTYNEANKRTQEYSISDRVKDQAYRIKEKAKTKLDRKADELFNFLKSLTFFPNTPEEFKLKVEKLIADIKGLQTKSSKIHDSLWKNIDNYKHRELITRLLALEDELKRSRKEFLTFPGSLNRLWNPNIEGDMSANDPYIAFGTPQVSPKKFMSTLAKNPDGTLEVSMAHRSLARREMIRMSLEAGLDPKQADLMLKDEDRTPQIVNQILKLQWKERTLPDGTKESYPVAQDLIIRVQPNGEKYLEHFKHNPLVNPIHLTNTIDVEEATRIIKKQMESQLRNIRKYNKKYFEPMFAIRVNNVEIGALGREYDQIMDEYNKALAEFNALPAAIQKNLHSVRNNWRIWTSHLLSHLKQLGWIESNAGWDEYVPYFVNADWSMKRWMGLPKKLKEQPAFYTSKAYGTVRERMLEPGFLVDHILNVQYDIIVSTHIDSIARDLDASYFLTEKEMEQFYKYDAHGNLHEFAKTGQVFPLEEDRKNAEGTVVLRAGNYVFWTPEYFKFSLGTNEDGDTVILDNVRSYLLEENIAKSLNSIALPYNAIMERVNQTVNLWKKTLIYTIYPAFNFANMLGDLQMYAFVHPAAMQSLRYLPKTVKFLVKYAQDLTGKTVQFSPFEAKLKAFIDNHNVIEASEMRADLGQRSVTNFFKFIASKLANFSMWREAILRTNNAYYLMMEEENGNVDKLKKQFGFLGVDQNIGDMDYLGRVSKELMIDYFRRSPAYQRWITGFLFPWAHFYLHGSKNVLNWMTAKGETTIPKRILKSAQRVSLLGMPPAVASLWNYGLLAMLGGDSDKAKQLYEAEMSLAPEMRNRFHIILGWDDGVLKVYCPQYLPDLLIGTKFVSVFNNQIFRFLSGEIGPKEAVRSALKDWAKTEAKSAAFLVNPLARFFTGLGTGTDPLDGSKVHEKFNLSLLSTGEFWADLGLYFNKVCNPILSTYVTEYQKKEMTHENAMLEALKRFGHYQNILGVKENQRKVIDVVPTNRENQILNQPGKRNITRELAEKKKELEIKESSGFGDLSDMWVRSGKTPTQFANDPKVKAKVQEMYKDIYKETMSETQWNSFIKRAGNIFKDPDNNIKWAENNMRRYKPGSPKYKANEQFKLNIQKWVKDTQRGIPVTVRGETQEIVDDIIDRGDE